MVSTTGKKITRRGDRKCKEMAMGFVILNLLIPEGLIGKVIFENRSERGAGSRCKDPEMEVYLLVWNYIQATCIGEVE